MTSGCSGLTSCSTALSMNILLDFDVILTAKLSYSSSSQKYLFEVGFYVAFYDKSDLDSFVYDFRLFVLCLRQVRETHECRQTLMSGRRKLKRLENGIFKR